MTLLTDKLNAVSPSADVERRSPAAACWSAVRQAGSPAVPAPTILILGSANADTITGGTGNDYLFGGSGNDAIGGEGRERLCTRWHRERYSLWRYWRRHAPRRCRERHPLRETFRVPLLVAIPMFLHGGMVRTLSSIAIPKPLRLTPFVYWASIHRKFSWHGKSGATAHRLPPAAQDCQFYRPDSGHESLCLLPQMPSRRLSSTMAHPRQNLLLMNSPACYRHYPHRRCEQ